jgi:hypothetical protein
MDDMALRRRQIDEKDMPEERKRVEHRKLDALLALCEASQCRRGALLSYFGESSVNCQGCDLCGRLPAGRQMSMGKVGGHAGEWQIAVFPAVVLQKSEIVVEADIAPGRLARG